MMFLLFNYRMNPKIVIFILILCLNQFQETGWIPQHIVAQDECESILGVVPLYLKRFGIYYAFDTACSHRFSSRIISLHLTALSDFCCLICSNLEMQPFIWWICFWSFLGWCLLQLWFKILSKVTVLCTVYSSNWSEGFGPQLLI